MNAFPGNIGTTPDDVKHALADARPWSLTEYQSLATRTINTDLSQAEGIAHAGMLVASDGGELCSGAKAHFFYKKKLDAPHGDTPGATLRDNLIEEAGDVLWGLAEMATRLGITLEDIARANMTKLLKRYPENFTSTAAITRADKAPALDTHCFTGQSIDEIANGHRSLG